MDFARAHFAIQRILRGRAQGRRTQDPSLSPSHSRPSRHTDGSQVALSGRNPATPHEGGGGPRPPPVARASTVPSRHRTTHLGVQVVDDSQEVPQDLLGLGERGGVSDLVFQGRPGRERGRQRQEQREGQGARRTEGACGEAGTGREP